MTVVVSIVGSLIGQKLLTISQLHYALIVLVVEAGTCHLAADTKALIIYRLLLCINSSILLLMLFYRETFRVLLLESHNVTCN